MDSMTGQVFLRSTFQRFTVHQSVQIALDNKGLLPVTNILQDVDFHNIEERADLVLFGLDTAEPMNLKCYQPGLLWRTCVNLVFFFNVWISHFQGQ